MAGTRTTIPGLPIKGTVTSGFGSRIHPVTGRLKNHDGTDIAGAIGTPIPSTISGTVVRAGRVGGYGNFVEIETTDGSRIKTGYGHLNTIAVRAGQTIQQGDIVGTLGNTGTSTGAHLHYEVSQNGKRVDPETGTPSNIASSQTPAVPQNPLSVSAQERLRNALDRDEDYLENSLNRFPTYSYHLKLFMVDPDTFSVKINDVGGMKSTDVAAVIDSASQVVIAESGVTAAINIKQMSFKGIPSHKGNSYEGTTFSMTLVEPLGTSLFDVITNSANYLSIRNFREVPYFIEITFNGYDENGQEIANLLSSTSDSPTDPLYENGGRWIYRVSINTINTSLTAEGAVHELEMTTNMTSGQSGQDGRTIPETLSVSGSTVGEFLDNFKIALEEKQRRRYPSAEDLYQYDFKIESTSTTQKEITSEIRSWSLISEQEKLTTLKGFDLKDGKPTMYLASDYGIMDALLQMFAATREGQKLGMNGDARTNESMDDQQKARAQIMPVIGVDLQYRSYDAVRSQYRKTLTYRIKMGWFNNLISDPKQPTEAKIPAVQKEMVAALRKKGLFRKRFDYLYTGLNTEVINLDIKFNMAWSAVLPNLVGYGTGLTQVASNATYNNDAIVAANRLQAELEKISGEYSQLEQERNTLNNAIVKNKGGTQDQSRLVSVTKRQADLADRRTLLTSDYNRRAKQVEQDPRNTFKPKTQKITYAEDLTDAISPAFDTKMIAAVANTKDNMVGLTEPYHRDRSIFSALLEQLVGHTAHLMTLEMTIRGDPYWLGSANLDQSPQADVSRLMTFDSGDTVFLLKVAYPFNAGDGSGESANIRQYDNDPEVRKDAYTGFYNVVEVTNNFTEGQFTQTITANRHAMLDVAKALGYDAAVGELDLQQLEGTKAASAATGSTETFSPSYPRPTSAQQAHTQKVLYQALRNKGWSDAAALTMVAEIGRENDYSPSVMFGSHKDNNNGYTNVGMVSWQKDRATNAIDFLRKSGAVDQSGQIIPGDAALRAQVDFIDQEMRTSYKSSYKIVRDNGSNYATIEPHLSKFYFKWDRAGTQINAVSALQKMSGYYASADKNKGG